MATLLGQLLLVLCVTLIVAGEYEEFGCKFDDEQYNYRDDKNEFGDNVKPMKFDDTHQFKIFITDIEEVRTSVRYHSLYNTIDPFIQMHKDYKAAKANKPVGYKFADFFPNYKPNPYMNKPRVPLDTIFSVIDIYQWMIKAFGDKYPTFKDSFALATCDKDIKSVVLDNVSSGIDQKRTPRGFVHDRIVGVIPFLIQKDSQFDNVQGFVIIESIHQTPHGSLAPIVMTEKYLNHTLSKNEARLFGPNIARYNWLPGTSESYIRIDYVEHTTSATGTLDLVGNKKIIQTDLLFMTPRSLCSFVKQIWKNHLLDTSVRLLEDVLVKGTPTRYDMTFELKPLSESDTLSKRWDWFWTFLSICVPFKGRWEDYSQSKYNYSEEKTTTILKSIPFQEVFQKKEYSDSLKTFSIECDIDLIQLRDMLEQFNSIYQKDTEFINEFYSYKRQEVDTATFWSAVTDTGN